MLVQCFRRGCTWLPVQVPRVSALPGAGVTLPREKSEYFSFGGRDQPAKSPERGVYSRLRGPQHGERKKTV